MPSLISPLTLSLRSSHLISPLLSPYLTPGCLWLSLYRSSPEFTFHSKEQAGIVTEIKLSYALYLRWNFWLFYSTCTVLYGTEHQCSGCTVLYVLYCNFLTLTINHVLCLRECITNHVSCNISMFCSAQLNCISASLYCTVLYYTVLYYTILNYPILYYTILSYIMLYYTILYYTIIYCTILYNTILYYTILYLNILYYTILYLTLI